MTVPRLPESEILTSDLEAAIAAANAHKSAAEPPAPDTAPLKPKSAPKSSSKSAEKPAAKSEPTKKSAEKSVTKPAGQTADKPTPVSSAKEAINAMYAENSGITLGDYLGASARKISETSRSSDKDSKSAASLHHKSGDRLESVRPSASALFRRASSQSAEDHPTVVRTSLKLSPKKPPIVEKRTAAPMALPSVKRRPSIDIRPGHTAPTFNTSASRSADPAIAAIKAAAAATIEQEVGSTVTVTRSSTRTTRTFATSSAKPVTAGIAPHPVSTSAASRPAISGTTASHNVSRPVPSGKVYLDIIPTKNKSVADTHLPAPTTEKLRLKRRPLDSIKNRFLPAPKGFATSNAREAAKTRPYQAEDFLNPSLPARMAMVDPTESDTVHLYGMMDSVETPSNTSGNFPSSTSGNFQGDTLGSTPSDSHLSAAPQPDELADELPLGIVEDYRRSGDLGVHVPDPHDHYSSDQYANNEPSSANRYVLGARSPYFLSSVAVEKRPLSDASTAGVAHEPDIAKAPTPDFSTPIYAGQDLSEPVTGRNTYEPNIKSRKSKSTKSSSPTVIIPSAPKSSAPLFLLLVITIILGGVVGALAYLCFFQ